MKDGRKDTARIAALGCALLLLSSIAFFLAEALLSPLWYLAVRWGGGGHRCALSVVRMSGSVGVRR
jgi:hypothetical protein